MATNSSALATIKEIVDGILFKSELPESKGAVIDQIVRDGYRKLNTKVLDEGVVIGLFTMDSNLIISLPSDLIKLNDVFVPYDNGVWSLTRNKLIPKITTISGGSEIIPEDWGGGEDIVNGIGAGYSTRGGVNNFGYYDVDEVGGRIVFRNVDRSEVMLVYSSSGINKTSETYVPIQAKEALEYYALKSLAAFGVLPVKLTAMYESMYEKEMSELRMLDFNFTHFTDATYRTFNSSVYR